MILLPRGVRRRFAVVKSLHPAVITRPPLVEIQRLRVGGTSEWWPLYNLSCPDFQPNNEIRDARSAFSVSSGSPSGK